MDKEFTNRGPIQRPTTELSGELDVGNEALASAATHPDDAQQSDGAANTTATTKPLRLCMLEDSYSKMRLILHTCHENGYPIDHFATVEDAVDGVRRGHYDALIVSDTMAGGTDTCESTIVQVRSLTSHGASPIPILVVASHADSNRRRALEELGATSILSELTEARLAAALASLAGHKTPPTTQPHLSELSVLLVEDSFNLTKVLTHAMTQTGRPVTHVMAVDQAVEALAQHDYDIVLLSQNEKPEQMSAVEFIELARLPHGRRTKPPRVWVVTNDATPTNIGALRGAGAEHVLDKRDPIRLGNALFALSARKSSAMSGNAKKTDTPNRARSVERPVAQPTPPAGNRTNALWQSAKQSQRYVWPTLGFFALTASVAGGVWFGWQAFFARTPVETVNVTRGTVELTAAATGLVVSKRQVDLTPTQTGQLYRVFINEGDLVRKGETVATLDNREATVNVRRAEAQVFRFRTELRLADKALQATHDAGEVEKSAQVESDAESTRALAHSKMQVAEQELNAAKVALDRLRITAPFSGAITRSLATEGKWVEAGTPLFTLADLNAREVALHVPGDLEQSVAVGLPVRLFAESTGERWQETVARVVNDRAIIANGSARAQTTVYVTLGQDATVLQLGQRVLARIVTDAEKDAVVAPLDAISVRDGRRYATVVDQGRIVTRAVELGIQNGREVSIRTGLKPGDVVVTSHTHLEEGQRVATSGAPPAVATHDTDRGVAAQ